MGRASSTVSDTVALLKTEMGGKQRGWMKALYMYYWYTFQCHNKYYFRINRSDVLP